MPAASPARSHLPRWLIAALALVLLVAAAWLVCHFVIRPDAWQKPSGDLNVILITIDTLRADFVSAYGGNQSRTPVLDSLAEAGTRFDHCVAQAPLTLPSHTSLLSSTYPPFNQVRDNGGFQVPGS